MRIRSLFRKSARAALVAALMTSAAPVLAQSDPGAYLAARQAAVENDFAEAARYYTQSLLSDPSNPLLLESALAAQVMLGSVDTGAPIARQMRRAGVESQLANLVLASEAGAEGRWSDIFAALEEGHEVSPLVDGLFQAWAALGEGDMTQALASFDEVIEGEGMRAYGEYHKALALASVGDFEGADAILAAPENNGRMFSVRAAIAHAQVLGQLGRTDAAAELLRSVFGETTDPTIRDLQERLEAGEQVPFGMIADAQHGMAEVLFMIATLLEGDARESITLQYARLAQYLAPGDVEITMLVASLLDTMERHGLAAETYALIAPDSLMFPRAELGRIDALRAGGEDAAAIEVAKALARSHPDLPFVHAKLADVLRWDEQYGQAYEAYSRALELYAEDDPVRWRVLFTRAIAAHSQDRWPEAEADFRAALDLRPDQPQVLNYLGYSLVERGEKLDEALQMIETAVAAQPDNGAIVDSLGWVLFQLGRYEEAVVHMERAAALEAVDPIVNDHLGDVYWAVGRKVEAAFQWHRALSFDPEPELADRIRLKLEIGLDAVLEQEGADPIELANDEG